MNHSFSQVPSVSVQRSAFDRSHGYETTFNAGLLIPVYVDEGLPGDTFSVRMSAFARFATPIKPIMDNMRLESFFFKIPMRLLWENWQRFNGEQKNPGDSIDFTCPEMTAPAGGYDELSLSDYMGIPTKIAGLKHNSFWHRAYALTYNEWFRDENLQQSVPFSTGDGPDDPADYQLQPRGKRHDYFTSCLPWPQKGEAVNVPLGTEAPVLGLGIGDGTFGETNKVVRETFQNGTSTYARARKIDTPAGQDLFVEEDPAKSASPDGWPRIRADLTNATAVTINVLRQAFQIQRMLERDARGGTRYTEIIRAHFGVVSPDARLQRPEYLGGGSTPVNFNPVAQTTSTDQTTPQGNLAAFGTVHVSGHGFTTSFTEHCVVIGLVNVRADLTYQQGLNRMFSRRTRYDFYWPALSHIGEQGVLNKEIYADGTSADEEVFGYQARFDEYRYKPSLITGKFRSNASAPLDVWHLSQNFASRPTLSGQFIEDKPPIERVIAVQTEPHFLFDAYFSYRAVRPMPVFGVPGLIDHF